MRETLTVSDVLEAPSENAFPVASEAFLALWQHSDDDSKTLRDDAGMPPLLGERTPMGVWQGNRDHEPLTGGTGITTLRERTRVAPKEWYQDWVVWTIAGGIAGGLLVTLLVTREGAVKSNSNISIKLP